MAELKFRDDQFQTYDTDQEFEVESKLYSEVQRPNIVTVPTSPATKLALITRMEKYLIVGFFVAVILLGLLTINIRTRISSSENEIAAIQATINQNKSKRLELQQEKNELSKTERIQKVAEGKGLSIKDDNIRNVK